MSHGEKGKRAVALGAGVVAGAALTAAAIAAIAWLTRGDEPTAALPPPRFTEEAAAAGMEHVYDGEFEYFVGGGAAVFDCDQDGRPDVYLAGGSNPAGLYANRSPVGGQLRFELVPSAETDLLAVTGAYPIDIDSDGHLDLAVLRVGENVMLRGLGDCRFERANEAWGIDGGDHWTTAFSAYWEGGSRLPTLAFGNYLTPGEEPRGCADHQLFRPDGGSYARPVTLSPGWCTLSILFSDWGGTGQIDLRMTNDRHYYQGGEEQLWHMAAGAPTPYGREDGWELLQIWGMGIASHDLTDDGLPEVYLTSQGDNKLQTLDGGGHGPTYRDIALERGATAHRPFVGDTDRPSTAWHAEFDDVNNDALIDLFVTKGNVEAMPEFAMDDPNNLLIGQPDGSFLESAGEAGLLDYARSRGAAVSDLNLDGLLDILVVERREAVKLWRNVGGGISTAPSPMGGWLALSLDQPAPNRDGIGAMVEVHLGDHVIRRELTIGGGHAGGELGWLHFGMGDADQATIRVTWPDGTDDRWEDVAGNQFLMLTPAGHAVPWSFGAKLAS